MQLLNAQKRPLRVLIAEDMRLNRQLIDRQVRDFGHETLFAEDGREAVRMTLEEEPDLILMDLLMPGIDGFEATRQIRDQVRSRWLPIVVLSSLEGSSHVLPALVAGADDFLAKPIDRGLLAAKLRSVERALMMQRRLTAGAERNQAVARYMVDAVVTIGADSTIVEANPACESMFGYAPGELVGEPVSVLMPEPYSSAHAGYVERYLRSTVSQAMRLSREMDGKRSDGAVFPLELSISEWHFEGERYFTGVLRDITKRREAERMKDEFIATVSHELRTPLTSIMGSLGLIVGGAVGEVGPVAQQLLDVSIRNSARLKRMIDDVLDLAKIDAGRIEFSRQRLGIAQVIDEALAQNLGYAAREGRLIATDLQTPEVFFVADPFRMQQVLGNLLSNAIKHSPPDEPVILAGLQLEGRARFEVRDRGPGIPESFRGRIFQRFAQCNEVGDTMAGGTGLGLAISRAMVDRMGGRIGFDSEPSWPTTFWIDFPLAPDEALGDPAKPRVLHLDRDADARGWVAAVLGENYELSSVGRLGEALAALDAAVHALVVLDRSFAEAEPERLLEQILAHAAGAPVLLLEDNDALASAALPSGLSGLVKGRTANSRLLAEVTRLARAQGGLEQ